MSTAKAVNLAFWTVIAALILALALLVGRGPASAPASGNDPLGLNLAEPVAALLSPPDRPWTPERMAAAEPLAIEAAELPRGLRPLPAVSTPQRSSSKRGVGTVLGGVRNYPNRVHGRVFASARGRDFTCSGTVVSSTKGHLISTAAHCVHDTARFGGFVKDLVFVPGYDRGTRPSGTWRAAAAAVPAKWVASRLSDFDFAMVQLEPQPGPSLQEIVGSRGIAFGQPFERRLEAFGYPGKPGSTYNGERPVRCVSRASADPFEHPGAGSLSMDCDMGAGASGGGWIARGTLLIASTSHQRVQSPGKIFGPWFGREARELYAFRDAATFPSAGPVRCGRAIATIVGTDRDDRLRGTAGKDVIAGLGGDDVIRGVGGDDRLCGGDGLDIIRGGSGDDRVDGGPRNDLCDGGGDKDRLVRCERSGRKSGRRAAP